VKSNIRQWKLNVLFCAGAAILLAGFAYGAASNTRQLAAGDKAKVTGSILSRNGDLVRVREKKSGELVVVNIGENTKIERKKSVRSFFRQTDMDVTAMVPGLTIEAEGVGNSKGQLDARKISFSPDEFAIEVAQEQQILANKAAAQNAQSAANQGISKASQSQSTATMAQDSANQASRDAQAAGALGIADAAAVAVVNQRVSDLDDYKIASEVDVWFDADSAVLKDAAKPALASIADTATALDGYLIEISGYASNVLSQKADQKLSEERAAAVARYFHEVKNIPMRRILVPVGYGTTHRLASNQDAEGRELNRRVDVKVLVNKGLGEGL
jgi:outer membrane protein OmpA-like peptidoglycan-associated protein